MLRTGRLIIGLAVLFLLQTSVVHRFTYDWLRPDLLVLAAVFLALEASHRGALCGAFAVGLLRDLGSCGRIGAGALLLVAASAAVFALRDYLIQAAWTDLAMTFAYVLAVGTVAALATGASAVGPQLPALLGRALGQAVFTTALCPLVFVALHRLGVVTETPDEFQPD
jgi:rod shape-determining protein MreD